MGTREGILTSWDRSRGCSASSWPEFYPLQCHSSAKCRGSCPRPRDSAPPSRRSPELSPSSSCSGCWAGCARRRDSCFSESSSDHLCIPPSFEHSISVWRREKAAKAGWESIWRVTRKKTHQQIEVRRLPQPLLVQDGLLQVGHWDVQTVEVHVADLRVRLAPKLVINRHLFAKDFPRRLAEASTHLSFWFFTGFSAKLLTGDR